MTVLLFMLRDFARNRIKGRRNVFAYTTYVESFNFMHAWWNLQLKVKSERQFLKLFLMAILLTRFEPWHYLK